MYERYIRRTTIRLMLLCTALHVRSGGPEGKVSVVLRDFGIAVLANDIPNFVQRTEILQ